MLPQVGTEGARFCVTQELAGRLRAPSVVTPKLPGAQGPTCHHFPKLCHLGGRGKMPCGQKRVKVEVETEISTPVISDLPAGRRKPDTSLPPGTPPSEVTRPHVRPLPAGLASCFSMFSLGVWEENSLNNAFRDFLPAGKGIEVTSSLSGRLWSLSGCRLLLMSLREERDPGKSHSK